MSVPSPQRTAPARRRVPRSVVAFAVGWLVISAVALWLGGDRLPFDRPSVAGRTTSAQVLDGWLNLLAAALLVAIALWMTRNRPAPDLAARAPDRRGAARELGLLLGYVLVVTAVGWVLGHAIGDHPFGLHLPGSLYGIGNPPTGGWIAAWCAFNLVAYAVVPYAVFRARGYDHVQLGLRSTDRGADLRLILVVLVVESVLELSTLGGPLFALPAADAARAIPLSFAVNLVGTVLPIAILIYGIMLPRFMRLTGSVPATAILGGLAYAVIHVFDGWALYTDLRTGVLTACFLVLQYFGPGLIKAVLTQRTGNTWVHVWGYHAIAPHATVDAPTVAHLVHGR
jgi:hypothetical protein